MEYILIGTVLSIIVSVISNKIIAAYYMKIIDSYTKDIIVLIKELVRGTNLQE